MAARTKMTKEALTMAPRTKSIKAAPTAQPVTNRESLIAAIAANEDYASASRECDRIMAELCGTQAKLEQAVAAANDGNELVAKIESGEALSAEDSADKIRILKQQLSAYTVAHNRAEGNRKSVLKGINKEIAAPLAADHRERLVKIADAMSVLVAEVAKLPEFSVLLKSVNLDPGNDFPQFGLVDLQRICPELKFIGHSYEQFLNGK